MAVTTFASSTQLAVISTEHFLSSPNVAGKFVGYVDLVNMAAGDVLELRVYIMAVTGGTPRVAHVTQYAGAQPTDGMISVSPEVTNALTDTNAVRFSLKQTMGTGRNFPWRVDKFEVEDTAAIAAAVWDLARSGHSTAGTFGEGVASVQGSVTGSAASVTAAVTVGTINASTITATSIATDAITAAKIAADAIGASELATDAVTEIVAGLLATALTEAYAADTVAPTVQQALWMLMARLGVFGRDVTGTTMTSRKLDKTTAAMTHTLDSATTPSSESRAT